jgi:hypothetical protein
VVLDVLARDVDIIGDLVDLVALLGADEDAGAAQPVNRRVVGVLWIDVPVVLLDLAATYSFQRRQICLPSGVPSSQRPQRAQAVGRVLRALRRVAVQVIAVARDRLQPT